MIGDFILKHLPALVVLIPLLAGLCALFLGRKQKPWGLALIVTWAVFGLTIVLLGRVLDTPERVIEYAMGNFRAPWGIVLRVDPLNAFVLLIVAGIGAVTTVFARVSVEREIADYRWRFFYSAFLLCLAGLLGITITGDAFNLYVLLEISSLSTYTLVALGVERDRRALTASFRYLALGTVGATFILLGIGHLYMVTGTLNMADLSTRLAELHQADPDNRIVLVAFSFIITGLGLKVALFPLHMWLPNAYTYAPSVVTAFLAATATKVGAYMTCRFIYTIFGPHFSYGRLSSDVFLIAFSLIAILYASVVAARQTNLKRLLAYSSVAQIGYIVLGIGLANVNGVTGAIAHVFNHALMKAALFLALGAVVYRTGEATLGSIRGMGRRMPFTMAAVVIGGLSLIGIPGTVGFISKWYLLKGCFDRHLWPVAVVVLFGSVLAVIYVWRILEAAYFREPEPVADQVGVDVQEAPVELLLPIWMLAAACVVFGIWGTFSVEVARAAAESLLGVTR